MTQEPLTERQEDAIRRIQEHLRRYGFPPSYEELAKLLKVSSTNAVSKLIHTLEDKGYLRLEPGRRRAIQLVGAPRTDALPLVGFVPAGAPVDAVEHVEEWIAGVQDLFHPRPDFLLRVRGESMLGAGIHDGDLVAIRKSGEARSGEIVVARVDGEVTLKRLLLQGDDAVLQPENPLFQPIHTPRAHLEIEGVFVGLIRRGQ
jgi:repressor LexA